MSSAVDIRVATKADLPAILQLYAQPGLDDGKVLPVADAERIFERMSRYPHYKVYVASRAGRIVGTFAMAIMDNLAHMGAPSALIEDVVVDQAEQGAGVGFGLKNAPRPRVIRRQPVCTRAGTRQRRSSNSRLGR